MTAASGYPAASEADFQRAVLDLAATLGIWHWHDEDSRRNRAGLPDLLLVGRHRAAWREIKTATGRLRPEQGEVIALLARAGQDVGVWRPEDLQSGRVAAELRALNQPSDR